MLSLVIFSLLLVTGLLFTVVGIVWRRGDHPVCRRCGFNLTGLPDPSSCPECGRRLDRRRAVATGDRRRWPVPVGSVLVGLAVVALGYAVLGTRTLDGQKPLWLLDAELRIASPKRDRAIFTEIERRSYTPRSPEYAAEMGDLVVRRIIRDPASPEWHAYVVLAYQTNAITAQDARQMLGAVLERFMTTSEDGLDAAAMSLFAEAYIWLGLLNDSVMAPVFEPLLARVERTRDEALASAASLDDGDLDILAWSNSHARQLLNTWVHANIGALSDEMMVRLLGEPIVVEFRHREKVPTSWSYVPCEVDVRWLPLVASKPFVEEVSVWIQDGDDRVDGHDARSGMGWGVSSIEPSRPVAGWRTGMSPMASPDRRPLALGTHTVDIDMAAALVFESAYQVPPPEEHRRHLTLSGTFEVVESESLDPPRTRDPEPGEAEALLDAIEVGAFEFHEQGVMSMRNAWQISGSIEVVNSPVNLAHAIWAEQGEHRWRLGNMAADKVQFAEPRRGHINQNNPIGPSDRDRLRREDGRFVDRFATPPDLTKPIRLIIEPDEKLFRRGAWDREIWLGTLDLGEHPLVLPDDDDAADSGAIIPPE